MTRITTKADRQAMKNYLRHPSASGFKSEFRAGLLATEAQLALDRQCGVCGGKHAPVVWTRFQKEWLCSHECFLVIKESVQINAHSKAVEVDDVDPISK